MHHIRSHALLTLLAVTLIALLTEPFAVYLNDTLYTVVVTAAAVMLVVWIGIMLQEDDEDPDIARYRAFAARWGFASGLAILGCGLVYEGLVFHEINWWILFALIAKLLSKFLARVYIESKDSEK